MLKGLEIVATLGAMGFMVTSLGKEVRELKAINAEYHLQLRLANNRNNVVSNSIETTIDSFR